MRALFVLLFVSASSFALAQQPAPFAQGDVKAGEALVKAQCVSCHAAKFPGEAERMFTRSDRKIKTPEQLLSQIHACNSSLKKNWIPEEEQNAAAYLNHEYYHFK